VKSVTIARNYAEALFAAGDKYGDVLDAVAGAISADERIAIVLESPRVSKAAKSQILEKALKGEAPREFVRFLQAVVRRGRQGLLAEIAQEYQVLLDVKLHRVHAGVTLADEADARTEKHVVERLAKALGREVVYNQIAPADYRALGFPGADDLGNMFQYYSDFEQDCCDIRNISETKSLNPELLTLDRWLTQNKSRIPLG